MANLSTDRQALDPNRRFVPSVSDAQSRPLGPGSIDPDDGGPLDEADEREVATVAKYLFKASYTPEGIKGVMKEGGSSRVNAVEKTVASLGGTLESFYFAFGATDVFVTVDLPDHATAVAFAAAVGSTGSLSTTETVVLLTPGEIDAAIHKSVDYRAPGS